MAAMMQAPVQKARQAMICLGEARRLFMRRLDVGLHGFRRYPGTAVDICRRIIKECYNREKGYFQVSSGHFCEFYCRDFGLVCRALIELGYKREVRCTLEYSLSRFQRHGRITTTINPGGSCFDFPNYAIDSLAFMLNSLSILSDEALTARYKRFLESETMLLYRNAVDPSTGLVRKDKCFSSLKDHAKRKSSCYDNSMLYLIQRGCIKLGIRNPLERFDYPRLIVRHFWKGDYFLDDLSAKDYVASDANIFPFWTGAVSDVPMLKKSICAIRKNSLDAPFPVKYASSRIPSFYLFSLLADGYERDNIWTHMGPIYIELAGRVDKKLGLAYLEQYKESIEHYGNYLETFDSIGRPYKSLFYATDEGMIWCANILRLFAQG